VKNVTAARRYARALYELALEGKSLDDVLQGMSNLRTAMDSAPEVRAVLGNPLVTPEQTRKVVSAVTSNALVLKFIELLARRGRIELLTTVHDLLIEMNDSASGVWRAFVKSAQPLTEAQKRDVEAGLAKSAGGKKVIGKFDVDASLLGGVWAKIGDKVLDASVRGRLDSMRNALLHSAN
jgi:F-type H+-transporting ATPase subunit delta